MKLNFKQFTVPAGISGKEYKTGDARESFADLIYLNMNGIRAHALALKIYQSEGMEEYDSDEVSLITRISERLCTPAFIDGLRAQIRKGGGE